MMRPLLRLLPSLLGVVLLAGCAGRADPGIALSGLVGHDDYPAHFLTRDGQRLPLRHWLPEAPPTAVVLAVHGFNDHAGSLAILAESLTRSDIAVYAYDQRGFGTTPLRGRWPGQAALAADATEVAHWLRGRYPRTPLYLVGKSMGAAVVILALTGDSPPPVDGSVLIAPAVWERAAMPWYQRVGLWLGVRLMPQARFSARLSQRLGIEPTDDPEIKRLLAQDPLILRSARLDTLHGVATLMDAALAASRRLPGPALILYGGEDQIIPADAICALLERLPDATITPWRLAFYPGGYHMLTRYSQRQLTHADIATWLLDPDTPLPSRYETTPVQASRRLCHPAAR